MRLARGIASITVAGLGLVSLTACSGGDEPQDEPAVVEETEAPADVEDTEEAEAPAEEEAPVTDGTTAAWATPVTTPGELLTTIVGEGFTVDVYQVGVTQATRTGQFVDPETNQPIIAEGSDIVFVNYVVTNTGAEAIPVGASLVNIRARYDDWPYLQGMDSVADRDLFAQLGVNADAAAPGSYADPYILSFEPGTSYSVAQNFAHQAGSPITFTASLTPVDEAGDLLHDLKQEVVGQATIA